MGKIVRSLRDRFDKKYTVAKNGCWNWTAAKVVSNHGGISYGQIWNNGKNHLAHRVSYELFKGIIQKGMTIDHQCDNSLCVNPDHLKMMILRDNIFRSKNSACAVHARKTQCKKGHPFDIIKPSGHRKCSICIKAFNKHFSDLRRINV